MIQYVPFVLFFVSIVLVIFLQIRTHGRALEQMRQVASRLGGRFHTGEGGILSSKLAKSSAMATIGDRDVHLVHHLRRAGKNSHWYTQALTNTLSQQSFRVYKSSVFSGLGESLGMQDVKIGDAAYDDRFVIKSSSPEWIRSILAPPLRREHLEDSDLSITLEAGQIKVTLRGLLKDSDRGVRMMRMAAALAQIVDNQGKSV